MDRDDPQADNLPAQPADCSRQTIRSHYNRLVVMTTDAEAWHSVKRVERDDSRCCLADCCRPEQPRREVLAVNSGLRQAISMRRPQGIQQTTHQYKKFGEHRAC